MDPAYFSDASINFLYELAANNNRDWFNENKPRYEKLIREPALALVENSSPLLAQISSQFVASPKKVGGSLMRVYRDTRFARDKTPYKTNIGIQFRHVQGKDVHAPGFYLHVGLDEIFIGVGIWRPDGTALAAIREAIDSNPKGWLAARDHLVTSGFELTGNSLKRPPRGFDKDHPQLTDLKRKDFIAIKHLSQDRLLSAGYLDDVFADFQNCEDYMRYLCKALQLPF